MCVVVNENKARQGKIIEGQQMTDETCSASMPQRSSLGNVASRLLEACCQSVSGIAAAAALTC